MGLTALVKRLLRLWVVVVLMARYGLPEEGFFEQMVGWVIDLIEKYIRASPAV